jgi:hypothetical protein
MEMDAVRYINRQNDGPRHNAQRDDNGVPIPNCRLGQDDRALARGGD